MVLDIVFKEQSSQKIDLNSLKSQKTFKIGGPPSFSGLIQIKLSLNFPWINPTPHVFAYACPQVINLLRKVPNHQPLLINLRLNKTCPKFHLIYPENNGERILFLQDPPSPFNPHDFNWRNISPKAVIVGSVYNEFNEVKIFDFLREQTDYIAFDPQGCFRHIGDQGEVKHSTWYDSKLLSKLNCLKLSLNEAILLGKGKKVDDIIESLLEENIETILITNGRKGIYLGSKNDPSNEIVFLPAFRTEKVVDETGAGDIFLTTYVHYYLHHGNKIMACAFASSIVSLFVEQPGFASDFSKMEIINRMRLIAEDSKLI